MNIPTRKMRIKDKNIEIVVAKCPFKTCCKGEYADGNPCLLSTCGVCANNLILEMKVNGKEFDIHNDPTDMEFLKLFDFDPPDEINDMYLFTSELSKEDVNNCIKILEIYQEMWDNKKLPKNYYIEKISCMSCYYLDEPCILCSNATRVLIFEVGKFKVKIEEKALKEMFDIDIR